MEVLVFGAAVLGVAALALATTYITENGLCLPDLSWLLPAATQAGVAGPYYCGGTKRWRDPVTKKFVPAPR